MKKKYNSKFAPMGIVLGVLLLVIIAYFSIKIPQTQTDTNQTKTFRSTSIMKFSIDLPNGYKAQEKLGSVTISTPNGVLYIDRNGTNFIQLEDYIKDLGVKNKFVLTNKKSLRINGLETITGIVGKEKLYFIYSNYAIYTLSAKDEVMYNALDQIAKSFRYSP